MREQRAPADRQTPTITRMVQQKGHVSTHDTGSRLYIFEYMYQSCTYSSTCPLTMAWYVASNTSSARKRISCMATPSQHPDKTSELACAQVRRRARHFWRPCHTARTHKAPLLAPQQLLGMQLAAIRTNAHTVALASSQGGRTMASNTAGCNNHASKIAGCSTLAISRSQSDCHKADHTDQQAHRSHVMMLVKPLKLLLPTK